MSVGHAAAVVSEEGAKNTEIEVFLAHLPPDTPVYCSIDQLNLNTLPAMKPCGDSFVIVKHIPSIILDEIEEQLLGRIDYSPSNQMLILKMPSPPHEEAAASFESILLDLARSMQVYRQINKCGASRVDTSSRKKQADRSYKPAHQARKWPTVAVEVGYTETTAKIHNDIAWWINASRGEVKQGITIDIKQGSGNIEIISWVPAFPILPSTIKMTSNGREILVKAIDQLPPPRIKEKIIIKRGGNGGNHYVRGPDLIIPFSSLLLKNPISGTGEGDFVLTTNALRDDLAKLVWYAMDDERAIKKRH